MELVKQFDLPSHDVLFLNEYGCPWETIIDGSHWVLLHEFSTQHPGYNHEFVTAAVRIETGYPKAALDMVYFAPHLARVDGKPIHKTNATQMIKGIKYQRWSRHYTKANPFVPGEHNLGTHILTIEDWLLREYQSKE